MLGDAGDVEDVVQEAWLRLGRVDASQIEDLGAWLGTVVRRLALDALGTAQRRRELCVGPWLTEQLADSDVGRAEERAAALEHVAPALGVVLENLSPSERAPFLLHDVFGLGFAEVATIVDRSPEACRQLAVRGRRHLLARGHRFTIDAERCLRVTIAFVEACAEGDLTTFVAALESIRGGR